VGNKRERMKRPAPVAELMATMLRGKPAGQRLEEGKIWLVWDAAVGGKIAAKARPVSFRDGILTVAVTSAPWMQQLTFLKKEMIAQLNERIGRDLVSDIYLKAGMPPPLPPGNPTPEKPERHLTAEETRRIAEQTASVSDPELRAAIAGVLARELKAR